MGEGGTRSGGSEGLVSGEPERDDPTPSTRRRGRGGAEQLIMATVYPARIICFTLILFNPRKSLMQLLAILSPFSCKSLGPREPGTHPSSSSWQV